MTRLIGSWHLLVWLIHSIAVCSQRLYGDDLLFDPRDNNAPRAVFVAPNELGARDLTISLLAFIYDHKNLSVVNLFSYSSKKAAEIDEIVLELDYNLGQTNFYVHGTKVSFDAIPPVEEWTQVYVSWQSKTGDVYYYIDGQLAGWVSPIHKRYRLGEDGYLVLGQRQGGYNTGFKPEIGMHGLLSDFNLWKSVLTQKEREEVHNCTRIGYDIRWMHTTWQLEGNVERQRAEEKNCGIKAETIRYPGVWGNVTRYPEEAGNITRFPVTTGSLMRCNCDEALEKLRLNLTMLTNDFQEKINEMQKQITTRPTGPGRDNEPGDEMFRKLSDTMEKAKEEINRIQRKNDVYDQKFITLTSDLSDMKQRNSENDKEICDLKAKSAVYEEELNTLKKRNEPTVQVTQLQIVNTANNTQVTSNKQDEMIQSSFNSSSSTVSSVPHEQIESNRTCPSPFIRLHDRCYFFSIYLESSWDAAAQSCRTLGFPKTLIALETKKEWDTIKDFIRSSPDLKGKSWWIGGSNRDKTDQWTWAETKQKFTFNDWCPEDARKKNTGALGHCAAIRNPSSSLDKPACWTDEPCSFSGTDDRINYICEV